MTISHKMTGSPTYNSWRAMKERCYNHNNSHFKNYGGRGIKVCDTWLCFEGFLNDMGLRPDGMTLERIDTDGDYMPSNCKWASTAEQNRNTKRSVIIDFNGASMCRKDWAEKLGITDGALAARLERWPFEIAMTAGADFTYSAHRYKGALGVIRPKRVFIATDVNTGEAVRMFGNRELVSHGFNTSVVYSAIKTGAIRYGKKFTFGN